MSELLEKVCEAARAAGEMILKENSSRAFRKEGHFNFVTETDLRVQDELQRRLSAILPEAVFYAEEQVNARLTDAPTWVVDPIDGTLNFMRGRDCSAVSIALLENGQPVLGVICKPFHHEMFTALKEQGARMNGREIRVSAVPFENAMISMGTSPYNSSLACETLERAKQFLLQGGDLRRSGSAAVDLTDVACGRSDVFFELQLSPWDIAAGALIVTEAGGVFEEFREKEITFDRKVAVLACNQACREKALELLNARI
ncbi:MAG: inositol monophosphatase [Clostridiales bacterium]|nr:inositol monophosphatase [Clostridiales bacterium]